MNPLSRLMTFVEVVVVAALTEASRTQETKYNGLRLAKMKHGAREQ
jgi:hypothetical protein